MSSNTSICKLCLKHVDLRKSHILPEFLYKPMYDNKHRLFTYTSYDRGTERPEQKGFRESLLCQSCETKRSKWETYAKQVIFGTAPVRTHDNGEYVAISGIDYEPFKLFLMSNLWMSGIASDPFFSMVILGPHEEKLRRMLYRGDPGEPKDYPCLVSGLLCDNQLLTDIIVQPSPARLWSHKCYRFIYCGFLWIYIVTSHRLSKKCEEAYLDRSGEMSIVLKDSRDMRFLIEAVKDIKKRYDKDGNLLRF